MILYFVLQKKCGDKVNTRKLTESAMLSALLVAGSILFLTSPIGYSIFLDIGVPIFITLTYLRCDFKYTLMSTITSLILVAFMFGNAAFGIWMIQSILIGFICGFLISKDTLLYDDLFYCSIFAAIVLIFVDIFFSGILGYSFITEAQDYLKYIPSDSNIKEVIFYILIAAMPLGTIIMTYVVSILLAKKLRLLNNNGKIKYLFIRKFKKFGSLQYCSLKTTYIGIVYLILIKIIGKNNILFEINYLKILLTTVEYVTAYFLIKDSYTIICGFVYKISKSRPILMLFQLLTIYSLISYFVITEVIIIAASILIDKKFSIRKNTEIFIKHINLKNELSLN